MRSRQLGLAGVLLITSAVLCQAARADVTLSTLPSNGTIGDWGTPDSGSSPSYGQVLTVPVGNPLGGSPK
jgi:hypothetical protein